MTLRRAPRFNRANLLFPLLGVLAGLANTGCYVATTPDDWSPPDGGARWRDSGPPRTTDTGRPTFDAGYPTYPWDYDAAYPTYPWDYDAGHYPWDYDAAYPTYPWDYDAGNYPWDYDAGYPTYPWWYDAGYPNPPYGDAGYPSYPTHDSGFRRDSGVTGPIIYSSPCSATINENMVDFQTSSLSYDSTCSAPVLVVAPGVTLSASSPAVAALTCDGADRLALVVFGTILGAGGDGGAGGNGGSGWRSRYCGRDGMPGGPAIELFQPVRIDVTPIGMLAGGGGGGGGISGGNRNAGGGGGAGAVPGQGGRATTSLSHDDEVEFCGQDNGVRVGVQGVAGSGYLGGNAIQYGQSACRGAGAGGDLGQPGEAGNCYGDSAGGEAGAAVERNGFPSGLMDGYYTDPNIRGAVR